MADLKQMTKKKKLNGTLSKVSGKCFRDILMFRHLMFLNDFWKNQKVNSLIISVFVHHQGARNQKIK